MVKRISLFIATGFYSGLIPIMPGTMGSLVAFFSILFILPTSFFARNSIEIYSLFLIFLFYIGVLTSTEAEKTLGHDAKSIVIDEIFGMFFSVILLPIKFPIIVAALILFRIFDILKPFPINVIQKCPRGWGVMLDDLLAGLYTVAILHVYLYFLG